MVENKLIEMDQDLNNAGIQCMKDVQNITGKKKPSDRYTSHIPTQFTTKDFSLFQSNITGLDINFLNWSQLGTNGKYLTTRS